MIVLDASAALELLLRTPVAATLEARLFEPGTPICAPHVLDLEVTQVLRRLAREKKISTAEAATALEDLTVLPINRFPHLEHLPRIWQLRDNLTAYDAAYVALAEALDAELLTCDGKLAGAPLQGVVVTLVT